MLWHYRVSNVLTVDSCSSLLLHRVDHVEHGQIDGEQNGRDRAGQSDSERRLDGTDEDICLAFDFALQGDRECGSWPA